MRRYLAAACILLSLLLTTACVRDNPDAGLTLELPEPCGGRTGAERAGVIWEYRAEGESVIESIFVDSPRGILISSRDHSSAAPSANIVVLDAASGEIKQEIDLDYHGIRIAEESNYEVLSYHANGESIMETRAGSFRNPVLPTADMLFRYLPLGSDFLIHGWEDYTLTSGFLCRLNAQGEQLWRVETKELKRERAFDSEHWLSEDFGGRELLLVSGDDLLLATCFGSGLLALDAGSGQLLWEYHLCWVDQISEISLSESGIWVSGICDERNGTVALLSYSGEVLHEVHVPVAVNCVGALPGGSCWFMTGNGIDVDHQVYFWEPKQEPRLLLAGLRYGVPTLIDDLPVFLNAEQGLLYHLQPDLSFREYELPVYGREPRFRLLGSRERLIMLQYDDIVYAISGFKK